MTLADGIVDSAVVSICDDSSVVKDWASVCDCATALVVGDTIVVDSGVSTDVTSGDSLV